MSSIKKAIAWVLALRPARVFLHFTERRGFLLAGGLSYQSLFAVFAAIWVGFAAFGLILKGNPALGGAFFDTIARSVPGLLAWRGAEGIIDPAQLTQVEILGWTGAIAAVGLLFTALGWLSSTRDAVRALFDLPGERLNFLLLKLKDLGLALGFGTALLVSSALSVLSTQALGVTLGWIGIPEDSTLAVATGRIVGLALMLLLDTVVLGILYRVLSGLTIPLRRLLVGSVLGAIALGVLKVLGGGASRRGEPQPAPRLLRHHHRAAHLVQPGLRGHPPRRQLDRRGHGGCRPRRRSQGGRRAPGGRVARARAEGGGAGRPGRAAAELVRPSLPTDQKP